MILCDILRYILLILLFLFFFILLIIFQDSPTLPLSHQRTKSNPDQLCEGKPLGKYSCFCCIRWKIKWNIKQ